MTAFSTKVVRFEGTNEYTVHGNVLGFERTNSFSFSFWFRTTASGSWQVLISKNLAGTTYQGYQVTLDSTGHIGLWLEADDAATNNLYVVTVPAYNDGLWRHCVMTYNGSSLASGVLIYINATVVSTTVIRDSLTSNIANSASFMLGGRTDGSFYYVGYLDEVAVYSKVLSAVEVSWIYNSQVPRDLNNVAAPSNLGAWWRMGEGDTYPTLLDSAWVNPFPTLVDISGSGFDGTLSNMESTDFQTTSAGGVSSRSLLFGGTDEYATFGDHYDLPLTTNAAAFSCWFKTTSSAGVVLMAKCDANLHSSSGGTLGYQMGLKTDGSMIFYQRRNGTSEPDYWYTNTTGRNDGNWHHVMFAKTSTNGMVLCVDGASQGLSSLTAFGGGTSMGNSPTPFSAAGRSDGTGASDVQIDEMCVHGGTKAAADALWMYNSGAPRLLTDGGAPTALVGWWRMGEDHNAYNGTMTNMESADIYSDAIAGNAGSGFDLDFGSDRRGGHPGAIFGLGSSGPVTTSYFKMRALDSGAGYVTWIASGAPDFAGAGYATGVPTPVGPMVAGSAVITDTWEQTVP